MWQAAAVGLGLGALAVVFLQRIRGIVPPDNPEKELTLQEHLEELQHRLVTVLVAWAFLALLFFSFGPETLRVAGYEIPLLVPTVHGSFSALGLAHLQAQFVPATVTVVVLRPVDAILAQLTVALLMAIVVSAPVAGYEVAAFLAPGLKPSERRLALRVTPVVSLLFLAGAAFAYLVMVPVTMEVLYGYAAAVGAQEFLQIDELVNFVVLLHVLFGIAFELPVIMAALSEVGLVDPDDWVRYWRHAVVVIVVLAAMVSDPSPVTQLIVAGPVILLYGLGVAASRWRAGGTGEDGN
jgi:sec-independent protein translocase protein TatC